MNGRVELFISWMVNLAESWGKHGLNGLNQWGGYPLAIEEFAMENRHCV
jgi:hypothetical protein